MRSDESTLKTTKNSLEGLLSARLFKQTTHFAKLKNNVIITTAKSSVTCKINQLYDSNNFIPN